MKNDNPHAIRLLESLAKNGKGEDVTVFAEKHPLAKSASVEKKFEWAHAVCELLSEKYDEETVKHIRMDCACGPELGKGTKLKELYEKKSSIPSFIEKANALNQGFTLEYDGESFYLLYPQCYCSCVKRVPQTLPETWCYCTLGYTKKMFSYIFGKDVQVELINSVKLGGSNCRIRIILP